MNNQYPLFTLRTQEIVGRRDLLARLALARHATAAPDAGTQLFYLVGAGGMGKTRILDELRKQGRPSTLAQPPQEPQCVTKVIDFYDISNHSSTNLQEAIVNALPEDACAPEVFAEYRKQLARFRNYTAAGAEEDTQREELRETFLTAWRALTEQCSVVVLLDTAELLQFQDDQVRAPLGQTLPEGSSKQWLFTAIANNKMRRTLFVVAARSRPALDAEVKKLAADHGNVTFFELEPLTTEESNDYFVQLANTLAAVDAAQAEDIRELPESLRHRLIGLTNGRPIALALALQLYLSNIGGGFRDLVELRTTPKTKANKAQAVLRQALMKGIMYEAFGEASLPLRIMPITRRGLTPELLQHFWGDVRDHEESAKIIQHLKAQIFVKERPDGSIVLHDEIADWAEHELYASAPGKARDLYRKVARYYHEQFRAVRRNIHELAVGTNQFLEEDYEEDVPANTPSPELDVYKPLLAAVEQRRRIAIDRLFYALRADPLRGYKYYYELAEEAFNVNLVDYDAQIHSEFLQWWDAKDTINGANWKHRSAARAAGISEKIVEADLAVRWVQRQFNKVGADAKRATVDLAAKVVAAGIGSDAITRHKLNTYAITAKGQIGLKDSDADEVRRSFIDNLRALRQLARRAAPDSLKSFLATDALAFAHYEAGYFHLVTFGHYEEAILHFTDSIALYKGLRFEINQARSLNDRAYALARAGELENAVFSINDALDLRIELGLARVAALSLNTKGIVHVYQFKPNTALALCERALSIFVRLEDKWGEMLARLALSEANRRKSDADGIKLGGKLEALEVAVDHSRRCLELARTLRVSPAQCAEILDEYACALRDKAKFLRAHPRPDSPPETIAALWDEAWEKLEEALRSVETSKHLNYLAMDFRTDQAYLAYDSDGKFDHPNIYLQKALDLEPEEEQSKTPAKKYRRHHNYRMQMAKIYALRAQISGAALNALANDAALHDSQQEEDVADSQQAHGAPEPDLQPEIDAFAYDATWTLFYTAGLPYYRQTRNAKQHIYDQLRPLSLPLLQQLSQAAKRTEQRLRLPPHIRSDYGLHAFIKHQFGVDEGRRKP